MRNVLAITVLLVLLPISARAQDQCTTDQNKFWICSGDVAWTNGYLIAPDVFDLRKCEIWQRKAELLYQVQTERDEYRQQRDDALTEMGLHKEQAEKLAEEYDRCALDYNKCTQLLTETENALNDSYSTLEVAFIGAGTGLGAILVGMLIGALAM